jgi:g-D-glutamyl-meso-diaminopimelate peptidase
MKWITRTTALLTAPLLALAAAMPAAAQQAEREVIGRSVEGRDIYAERIGTGPVNVLIVGGIHGAYEANSIRLSRRFAAYYRRNPAALPERFTLHVIDNMNPDGLFRITGGAPIDEFNFRAVNTRPGRFNARGVDLNRNWDGDWRPTSHWRGMPVDAGSRPFSEPETRAVRDYFLRVEPTASVFFQSAGAFLWYSGAEMGWEPSLRLAEAYSRGSGYRVARPDRRPAGAESGSEFDITGSADDYFIEIEHRNITVELTTHYDIEWERNLAGFESFLEAL